MPTNVQLLALLDRALAGEITIEELIQIIIGGDYGAPSDDDETVTAGEDDTSGDDEPDTDDDDEDDEEEVAEVDDEDEDEDDEDGDDDDDNAAGSTIEGGAFSERIAGTDGDDIINGNAGQDRIEGGDGDDILEGGLGNDKLFGGDGDDILYAFGWAGEPVPDQDASAMVNPDEPINDRDLLNGGDGEDTFVFRWLIDAKDSIVAKHTDASGNIDYSGNGIAGENDNTHDHWVESIGRKVVRDFEEGVDSLVFEGHTVQLDTLNLRDMDRSGELDTVLTFVSNQGGAGAHDGDKVGTVIILDTVLDAGDVQVDAGVYFGVEEPYSELG